MPFESNAAPKFSSPEEELAYLRAQVAQKETELARLKISTHAEGAAGAPRPEIIRAEAAAETIAAYAHAQSHDVLHETFQLSRDEREAIMLELAPDPDDAQIGDLLGVVKEKGIKNALSVVAEMGNAHIADDFHRALAAYIQAGLPAQGVKEGSPMWELLHLTLYEVSLPELGGENGPERPIRELVSAMEQFYAGMLGIGDDRSRTRHFVIEIGVDAAHEEIVFYIAVPSDKKALFEKQILSVFPRARLTLQKNDYNIFVNPGAVSVAEAQLAEPAMLPLKTYEHFDTDPLTVIINAFTKIATTGEGAAMQLVIAPSGERYLKRYKTILEKVEKGKGLREAVKDTPEGIAGEIAKTFREFAFASSKPKKEEGVAPVMPQMDTATVDQIREKMKAPICASNLRIVASAADALRADAILSDILSSFNQFTNTSGNRLVFEKVGPRKRESAVRRFTFREFSADAVMPLSLRELSSLMHVPVATSEAAAPSLRAVRAAAAPAPMNMPQEGVLLGKNRYRGTDTEIRLTAEDRLRHLYVIGQTGTGKTTILKNMILQDIQAGEGVCMIDPHGSDVMDVLANIPDERIDDVIYFDPASTDLVMGLNMLEYDERFPEQKTFVVNELFNIFRKLYGDTPEAMGPAFEQYFRNAALLVLEDPQSGNTLLDVSRVLADARYRELKLLRAKNPVVVQFWRDIATKAQGEASLQNIVPYITNKFDVFTANEIMRPIIAQGRSALNLRQIMDERKILLVNLSKGRLGDINANLIGLIIVGKILMAALSRADNPGEKYPPFYLFIDEFQNITTDSISAILSEARKYRLSLTMAHQFIAQLEENIRNAVFGNVGSMAIFRVGADDAQFLEGQFAPTFSASDIINIDNYNCYLKMLARGVPQKPFNIETLAPQEGDRERARTIAEYSRRKYGRPRHEVENEIVARYQRG